MTIELPMQVDDDVAVEIRADLADGRPVTIRIEADEAGEIPDLIEYQLETSEAASAVTPEYREWKKEREEPAKSGRFF